MLCLSLSTCTFSPSNKTTSRTSDHDAKNKRRPTIDQLSLEESIMASSFSIRGIIHVCVLSITTMTTFALALPLPLPSTLTSVDHPTQHKDPSVHGTISKAPHIRLPRHISDPDEGSFDATEWYITLFLIIALSSASIAVVLAVRR